MKEILPEEYGMIHQLIDEAEINSYFAKSVIERHVKGVVFADNPRKPRTAYVLHPYGLSLLVGDSRDPEFNKQFGAYAWNEDKARIREEWMQASPADWETVLCEIFGSNLIRVEVANEAVPERAIELHTRVNFTFNQSLFHAFSPGPLADDESIAETDAFVFNKMPGKVIPRNFWDSKDDFLRLGKGYTLLKRGEVAATAYSAYVHQGILELGIETVPEYRGMGYAGQVCARLIRYCLENSLTPVWSCRLGNTSSYNLAIRLGFVPIRMIPCYRLPV